MNDEKIVGITSPPYEEQTANDNPERANTYWKFEMGHHHTKEYGQSQGQIGKMKSQPKEELDFDITKYHKCGGELYWHGCYGSEAYYKQFVTPESYAHPAKISFLLAERIFKHLEHLGLLKEGMTVLDFMSGSGRIPLLASINGYTSIGVELEPHFVKMSDDNKKHAENKIGKKLDMTTIQGDSRKLSELLKEKEMVGITSPPYQDAIKGDEKTLEELKKIADKYAKNNPDKRNIFMEAYLSKIGDNYHKYHYHNFVGGSYSSNPQNIGNLKDKELVGITSPPYVAQSGGHNVKGGHIDEGLLQRSSGGSFDEIGGIGHTKTLGLQIENPNNIGSQKQSSYLSAMLQVYQEAYKSGMSVLVTVTKNPTRAGKLRRLDLDTAKLIELSGFKIIDYHRAVLFKTHEQHTLTGSIKKEHKGRLSFFKRLSLAKGNKASEWEDVIIGVREW